MHIRAGEYLCLEGDKASSLYIVKSGMLQGSSKSNSGNNAQYGPGSIIGEFSLLESEPRDLTLRATEDSEILIIEQSVLQATLANKPIWLNSILQFLSNRNHIAQENKKKNDLVQALPSLLFIFASYLKETGLDNIPLELLHERVNAISNTSAEDTDKLLQSLQELGLLKIQGERSKQVVRAESLQIIPLLYETLRYRALNQKVSPNILSMTDQMVLSSFVKLAQESNAPLHEGLCTISTDLLKKEAKNSMHGFTLTMRTLAPLVQKQLLQPSSSYDIHAPLESIDFFYADFDKILDLLELNRIFPLLDKKLV